MISDGESMPTRSAICSKEFRNPLNLGNKPGKACGQITAGFFVQFPNLLAEALKVFAVEFSAPD